MAEPQALAAPVRSSRNKASSRQFNFTDAEIRRALERISDLSALQEQLMFRLCCLSLRKGFAWMSQARLAELLRCTPRSVYTATKVLCGMGLLQTTLYREGLHYRPRWHVLGLATEPPDRSGSETISDPDRKPLPMHYRSTTRSDKTESSSTQAASTAPAAASFSKAQRPERRSERESDSLATATQAVDAHAAVVAEEAVELGAVLDRFGPQAVRDVRDVLAMRELKRNPTAARAALERLLLMQPDTIRASAGACFRSFTKLALEGRLAPAEQVPSAGGQAPRAAPKPAPDPLRVKLQALRDRLSYTPATHPNRARLANEVAELERRLVGAKLLAKPIPSPRAVVEGAGPSDTTSLEVADAMLMALRSRKPNSAVRKTRDELVGSA